MKRNFLKLSFVAVIAVLAFSCSNKETESRIAKLEGKVAELEAKNSPSISAPAATNTPAAEEVKPEGPLPVFEFTEELHDFGQIKEGDQVEHTFKFKNVGEAPLIISNASASCGCTVPEWPKEPIAVGNTGEIKVRFNSKGKPGIQNKTVTITANTYPSRNTVRIKADVAKAENPS